MASYLRLLLWVVPLYIFFSPAYGTMKIFYHGICEKTKRLHNTGLSTVAIARAEWIDHISFRQRIKPCVHVEEGTVQTTTCDVECRQKLSMQTRGSSVTRTSPSLTNWTILLLFFSFCMFCSTTPHQLPQWRLHKNYWKQKKIIDIARRWPGPSVVGPRRNLTGHCYGIK